MRVSCVLDKDISICTGRGHPDRAAAGSGAGALGDRILAPECPPETRDQNHSHQSCSSPAHCWGSQTPPLPSLPQLSSSPLPTSMVQKKQHKLDSRGPGRPMALQATDLIASPKVHVACPQRSTANRRAARWQ